MTIDKILLPNFGAIKNKEGKHVWGRLPYEFSFKSKEEYLAWRKVWKAHYKALSVQIRETKIARNVGFRTKSPDAYKHQYDTSRLKEEARTMLEILTEGKALSWQMKLSNQSK